MVEIANNPVSWVYWTVALLWGIFWVLREPEGPLEEGLGPTLFGVFFVGMFWPLYALKGLMIPVERIWNARQPTWKKGYQHLMVYKAAHGDCNVSGGYQTDDKYDGYALGKWVSRQRTAYATGKLSAERIARLEDLGFVWRLK